ncbi:hypothetical protein Anas_07089, partial [Armadillidium nasatum]
MIIIRKLSLRSRFLQLKTFCSLPTRTKVGYIVGTYENEGKDVELTEAASKINNHCSGGLVQLLNYHMRLMGVKSLEIN